MLNCNQFRNLIIKPTLSLLQMYSPEAEELLVFTCANESMGGHYLAQVKGPALGIFQMEPATHSDIWVNYIRNRNSLATLMAMHLGCSKIPDPLRLTYDLQYATAMARIDYMRMPGSLPAANDVEGMWNYYKTYYNSASGAAGHDEAIQKYRAFVAA